MDLLIPVFQGDLPSWKVLPEVVIEGVEEVDDVHAQHSVNRSVLQERKARSVVAPYVQSAAANGLSVRRKC